MLTPPKSYVFEYFVADHVHAVVLVAMNDSNFWSAWQSCGKLEYSCLFNTSHTVLGDMPHFDQKLVCITRHVIQFHQRPGWNTRHTDSLLMWQWHHFCFEVTGEGLRPGWNWRHGKLFTHRPGWNKRNLRKIQCVLIKSPVTCIQDKRVLTGKVALSKSNWIFWKDSSWISANPSSGDIVDGASASDALSSNKALFINRALCPNTYWLLMSQAHP